MDYTPPDISSLLGIVDTFLRWQNEKTQGDRKYFEYHPSEWGKCLRTQQYKHYAQLGSVTAEPEKLTSTKLRLFEKGHNMQSRWERYFTAVNILRGVWKCRNPLCFMTSDDGQHANWDNKERQQAFEIIKTRVYGKDQLVGCFKPDNCICGCKDFDYHEVSVKSKEMNLSGHADCILDFSRFDPERFKEVRPSFNIDTLPKKPIVIDMKTIGEWAWKKQIEKIGLHDYYRTQILIYAHILECEYGVVIYENKNNSQVAAFKVEKNEEMFNNIKWQSQMMQKMVERKMLPPPRPETKDDFECKYCSFSNVCHQSAIWDDPDLDTKRHKFYKT